MDEGRALAEQAVAEATLAGEALSNTARAGFLQALGQICWWHGDPQSTVRYCTQALQLAPDRLSPITAEASISLVSPYLYWRDLDSALHYAETGLKTAQTLHLQELLPSAYTALGNVLTRSGEFARAETYLRQSMELAETLGLASYERLMAAGYLAYNLYGRGAPEEARQAAEGALWAYKGSLDTYEALVCRSVLADVALQQGQIAHAERLYSELVEADTRRQFRIPLAMVHFGLAYVHLMTGRTASGLEHARLALHLIEPSQAIQLFLDQGDRSRIVCKALQDAGETSLFLKRVLESLPEARRTFPVPAEPVVISLRTLGLFRVFTGGEEISQDQWVSTKARDLLAYFITFRGERISAERAFDAVWPGKDASSMTAFHTALSRLRRALRKEEQSRQLIFIEAGEYWLDPIAFKVDVDEFNSALAAARSAATDAAAAAGWQQAVELYHGEYLDNLYYDWLLPERARLTRDYIDALRSLANHHFTCQRHTIALELLQRALRVDSLIEELHCQVMRVHSALGDRVGLVYQYQDLCKALLSELGLEPLPATTKLYNQLLEDLEK